jgi:regulator of protease activity HflC (stomatin/prohibitin superfamily)
MDLDLLVPIIIVAALVVFLVISTVRVVPQARRYNVERFGRYRTTLQPGLNFIIPVVDRINTKLDVREHVFSSQPQPVITEDNLVVNIDTVLYYQITDPRAAAYEVANYLQAIDQLTVTTLRNVIGSMDLERTLTSREEINARLRTVLDEATGKWGIRVNRVEIKAIDPPATIKEAMEKQMRAERDKRAVILHAEGERQSKILTAEGTRQQEILVAQGDQQAAILRTVRRMPSNWSSRRSIATTQTPRCSPTSTWRRCLIWPTAATTLSGSSRANSPRLSAPLWTPSAITPGWALPPPKTARTTARGRQSRTRRAAAS